MKDRQEPKDRLEKENREISRFLTNIVMFISDVSRLTSGTQRGSEKETRLERLEAVNAILLDAYMKLMALKHEWFKPEGDHIIDATISTPMS